jgi:hypothetical protein
MVTIYEGSIDQDCVRYEHHSLVLFYVDQSQRYAEMSQENCTEGVLQSDSIVAIVYAAMSIEAFLNETAESVIEKGQLDDFTFLRNEFKKRGKSSAIVKKTTILFQEAFEVSVPQTLLESIEELVQLRNNLIHYKISDTATKKIYPPLEQKKTTDGQTVTCIDFTQKPKTIIPAFVQRVTNCAAMTSYKTADSLLQFWNSQITARSS